jgi:toxin ParE1/3/4
MAIYKIADPAQTDLREIWQYISRDDKEIATRFIRELIEKFILLADNRLIGTRRSKFGSEIRTFPHKKYLVFYIPIERGVEIIRVLHSARNIKLIFEKPFED